MSELKQLFKQLLGDTLTAQTIPGTVKDVDKITNTCTFQPADESPEMFDVRLTASIDEEENVFVVYPAVGSDVLVTLINGNENVAFVSLVSKVEEISVSINGGFKYRLNSEKLVFNDGSNGGLPVVSAIVEKLNRLEERMATHQHTYVAAGVPAITTPDPASNTVLTPTQPSDLENTKIEH